MGNDSTGQPTTSPTVTTTLGTTMVKDPASGMTITVPYIEVSAGSIKQFTGDNAYLLICIRGRPAGYSIGELCLASSSNGANWAVVDEDVLLATGNQICGWTPHLTQFAILPKSFVMNMKLTGDAIGTAMPLAIDQGSTNAASSGSFATWKIIVIVIAAVICLVLIILLIVCLACRGGSGKPKQQRRRGNVQNGGDDEDMQALEVYDDKSVTNPAFARVSNEMESTRMEDDGESTMQGRGGNLPAPPRATSSVNSESTMVARGGLPAPMRGTSSLNSGESTMVGRPGTMTRAARADDKFKSTVFQTDESSDDDRNNRGRVSNAELDMDSYQTLRKEVVEDDNKGQSIIDMSTYKTLTKEQSGGRNDSAIDAAIFEALESSSE